MYDNIRVSNNIGDNMDQISIDNKIANLETELDFAKKRGDDWYEAFKRKVILLAEAEKRLTVNNVHVDFIEYYLGNSICGWVRKSLIKTIGIEQFEREKVRYVVVGHLIDKSQFNLSLFYDNVHEAKHKLEEILVKLSERS
jgi:hypothetical protein